MAHGGLVLVYFDHDDDEWAWRRITLVGDKDGPDHKNFATLALAVAAAALAEPALEVRILNDPDANADDPDLRGVHPT
jgi:hypothetical protein